MKALPFLLLGVIAVSCLASAASSLPELKAERRNGSTCWRCPLAIPDCVRMYSRSGPEEDLSDNAVIAVQRNRHK
jgi:hypothetical protein